MPMIIEDLGFSRAHRIELPVDSQIPDVQQSIPATGISNNKLESLSVNKLLSETITSKQITLGVTDGDGDVYFNAGKTDFDNTQTGFIMGIDDSDSNKPKFYIGTTTNYFNFDGTNVIIAGTLTASAIHIPDENTTANSFHVESDGDTWWGCTHTNFTADVENATAYILKTGVAKLKSVTLETSVVIKNLQAGSDLDGQYLAALSVGNAKISDCNVSKLTAGSITSKAVTLAVADGTGDSYFNAGKTDFDNTQTGFILGIDDSDSNKPKFYIGSTTQYFNFDGTNVSIKGAISATSLDIPDTTTANSFHVDADGNTWWGANVATGYAGAPAYVLKTGAANFSNVTINGSTLALQDIFGNGGDGAATISVDTLLTSDKFYTNLTVNSGIVLTVNGYRVFVNSTLTNNGTISADGNNGTNALGTIAGSGGSVIGGASLPAGEDGKNGGAGGFGGNGAADPGDNGNNGTAGDNTTKSLGANGVAGGNGGAGGTANPSGGAGGSGGTAGAAGTTSGTIYNYPRNSIGAYLLYDTQSGGGSHSGSAGSGSGAGGGGGGAAAVGGEQGGNGGGGGGSGSTGGFIEIFAKTITNSATGTISANGGNGGNGANGTNGTIPAANATGGGGGGGGGSGGDGGVILLIYSTLTNNGTISASGGTKGNKGTGGTGYDNASNPVNPGSDGVDGTNGNAGTIIQITV